MHGNLHRGDGDGGIQEGMEVDQNGYHDDPRRNHKGLAASEMKT